jgi:hypothetical protein
MYVNNRAINAAVIEDDVPAQEAENTRNTFGALVDILDGDQEATEKLVSFMHQGILMDALNLGIPDYVITQPFEQQGFKACVKTTEDQVEILLFGAGNKRYFENLANEGEKVWAVTTLVIPKSALASDSLPESVKQSNYILSRNFDPSKESSQQDRFEAFFKEAPQFEKFSVKTEARLAEPAREERLPPPSTERPPLPPSEYRSAEPVPPDTEAPESPL